MARGKLSPRRNPRQYRPFTRRSCAIGSSVGRYRHSVDFSAGKLYAQIIGDRLGDLAFHREHVGELAIIGSAQRWASVMALISWTFTRTWSLDFWTEPSRMLVTPSCFAICRKSSGALLNRCVDVREITLRSATFARRVRISSCTPSPKNALSGSRLKLSKAKRRWISPAIRWWFRRYCARYSVRRKQSNGKGSSHDHDINPSVTFPASLRGQIDIFRTFQALRRQFKRPCDDERDGEPGHDCQHTRRTAQFGISKNGKTCVAT